MCELFENYQMEKGYLAVVRGYLQGQARVAYPLKVILDKVADKFSQEKESKEAITDYQSLAAVEMPYPVGKHQTARYSLVELFPQTGRKHQLRRHLKHLFHLIMDDTKYDDLHQNRALNEHSGVNRLMLHSHFLRFVHPKTSQKITIKAPLDDQWQRLFQFFNSSFPDF